ncbi:MAG: S8 family serine peptidase [Gammaproteobacteria bacterium]|jgi:hypothetical protein
MSLNRFFSGRLTAVVLGLFLSVPIVPAFANPAKASADTSAHPIRLSTATFRPALGERPAIPPGLTIAGYEAGQRGYYIVQFSGPVAEDWKATVEAQGAEILEYIPDFAFKVRMSPGQAKRVETVESVSWVGLFQPAFKLRPGMLEREGQELYRIRLHSGADAGAARAQVLGTGARLFGGNGGALVVWADSDQLRAMARILEVGWIEGFAFREKHNEYASGIVGADTAHANGYDGAGQTIAVADTGLGTGTPSGAHPGIDPGRIVDIQDWVGVSDDPTCYQVVNDGPHDVDSGHGTHVAVSAVGADNADGEGGGTAPGAGLVFQAVENLTVFQGLCSLYFQSGYYLFGIPYDIRELFDAAYQEGARIHSDSWGTPNNPGAYDIDSFYVDDFIWNHPDMTITYSAGNSGDDFNHDGYADTAVTSGPDERYYLSTPATAKNLITVGASENDRQGHYECDPVATNCSGMNDIFWYGWAWPLEFDIGPIASDLTAGNAEQMAGFSSRGPTQDNRLKPDIVAPGTWILSGYSDMYQEFYDPAPNPETGLWQVGGWFDPRNAEYKYFGGTSMSTPLVAGGAAVVRQYYEARYGHEASAALVKATLINSAVDLLDENNDGQNDNDIPIPNNHEGWGRMDLNAATDGSHVFEDAGSASGLFTNDSSSFQYTVENPGSPLRISLVWTDYPSTEGAAVNLVNDLDLEVIGPGGETYRGNVFSGGWSQTGGAADRANNVENVYVQSAGVGAWTVTVSAHNVPNGPQPYALVVDGDLGEVDLPPTVAITSPADGATVSDTVTILVNASDDVTRVDFAIDGGNIGSDTDGSDGWSLPWDTTQAAEGTHTIAATATDTASQTRTDSIDVTVDNVQPPPPGEIHVSDLDGSSADAGKGQWTATVTISVSDAGGAGVENAVVEGAWGGGANGTATCATGGGGTCQVARDVRNKFTDATFTVTNVSAGNSIYDAGSNSDPDGDSDGTTIVVPRDGGGTEPPPPPSGPGMHVADLDGTGAPAPRNRWTASVTIKVVDEGAAPLTNMTVSGSWSAGGSGNCATDASGLCTIEKSNLKGNLVSTTFSVTDIADNNSPATYVYDPGSNGDPDGDSNGTEIVITQP